ncbi:MAG TPA: hypothetical protein VF375_08795 [Candidatus Limnocylindrales bacterium]
MSLFWRRLGSSITTRLGAPAGEFAGLIAIFVAAAALRLVNLPVRGGWDSD